MMKSISFVSIKPIILKSLQIAIKLLSTLLAFLVLAFIFTLAVYALSKLTSALNINEYIKFYLKGYPYLSEPMQHFLGIFGNNYPSDILIIIAALLISMVILSIFNEEKGLIVLPFDVGEKSDSYSGKAISDQIVANLWNIRTICENNSEISIDDPERFLAATRAFPSDAKSTPGFSELGSMSVSSISIPLGQILVILMQTSPIRYSDWTVSGSLQNFGPEICLVAHIRNGTTHSIEIQRKLGPGPSDSCICNAVRELSFKIAYNLKPKSTSTSAQTWRGFMYFIEATEALNLYGQNRDVIQLERARIHSVKYALKSAIADKDCRDKFDLLKKIYIAYLNKGDFSELESICRNIIISYAKKEEIYLMWGVSLNRLNLVEESLLCYNMELGINESAEAFLEMGISLIELDRYNEAVDYLEKTINMLGTDQMKNELLAFAWLWKGVAVELSCNKINAVYAYKKAIEINPSLTFIHSILARLYIFIDNHIYKKEIEDEITAAKENIYNMSEYSRACFEANHGDKNESFRLLWLVLENNQVAINWFKKDPDLKSLRGDSRYWTLVDAFSDSEESIKLQVSKAAIYKKLGLKQKFNAQCILLRRSLNNENEYIRACFEAVCGNSNNAIELLRIALEEKQTNVDEIEVDPDLESIRDNLSFRRLLNDFLF
jgi:tetratricopeptide (TPR) repeat protein